MTRSPVGDMPSPVYTQNELPPWAHPTPSPSEIIRTPDFSCDTCFKHPEANFNIGVHPLQAKLAPESLIIDPGLLSGICMPFIQQMLEALQHAMQSAIKAHMASFSKEDCPPDASTEELFRVAKNSWHGQEVNKSRGECAQDDIFKTQSSVTESLANLLAAAMEEQKALQEDSGSAKSQAASVGSSPVLHGLEPPWRAMVSAECSNAFTPAEAANLVYVSCFQQPVGQGCGDQQSLGEANDCGTGLPMSKFEPDEMCNMANMSDLELDKSNVVCRHWKSKGWCRLEDKCKFLHPENNCSEGNIVGSKADGPGEGIVGSTNAQEEGKGAAKSKPSRRGGRNRRGGRATVSDSCGSIGTGGIIVMASTFDS